MIRKGPKQTISTSGRLGLLPILFKDVLKKTKTILSLSKSSSNMLHLKDKKEQKGEQA